MRRRADGFRPVMEFLIASAALQAKADGLEFLSLSGAPLARLDRGEPVAGLQGVLDLAGRVLEPVYGFGSLLAFKAKFQPEYRPLYLAYPDPAALGSIATAIGRAYLPGLTVRQATRLTRRLLGRPRAAAAGPGGQSAGASGARRRRRSRSNSRASGMSETTTTTAMTGSR
jgi:phosphatidylglycerol lysyltransferase